ncbi:MAG: SPOR domain-containing protein [Casimicrobiaceae bacterium]
MASTVAYYLGRSGLTTPLVGGTSTKEAGRAGKADAAVASAPADKPRFDFYKILPGGEEPKAPTERKGANKSERPAEKTPAAIVPKASEKTLDKAPDKGQDKESTKVADRYWLQAGAFSGESDAENLRARLALSGWEALIQTVPLPDKSLRYRVRLGPYDNTDQLNRVKNELGKGGFDVAVIRNP